MAGWYVEGEEEIAAVHELEGASDRSSAIVAASFIETRLEHIIRARLAHEPSVIDGLLRVSGPLGNLSTKVDLALLIGVISKEAHKDLVVIKNVRNEFAHKLASKSFDMQRIKDLCSNLKLIETMINPIGDETWRNNNSFMIQMQGYPECLESPRGRFLTAARLFNLMLHPRNKIYRIDCTVPHI
jgi:DNA-binding MltR family transcriptional regulator